MTNSSQAMAQARESHLRAIPVSARLKAIIQEKILSMQLMPGSAISEKEIAEAYGVSRTPVREALMRLAGDRLIDIFPQRGTFVSRIQLSAVRDAMVIREALERITAREAALKADRNDVKELMRVVDLMLSNDRAGNLNEFHAADERFHQLLALIADHPNLWRVVKQEKLQVDRCRMLTLPLANRRTRVIEQHAAIVEAVSRGSSDHAARAMDEHLADVLPSFNQLLESYPDFFEPTVETSRPYVGQPVEKS